MSKYNLDTKEMEQAGAHLGHRTSKLYPKMSDYVKGIKSTIHIIDLEKTQDGLEKALDFLAEVAKNKGVILFASTKIPLKKIVKETAQACGMPFAVERWLGGTFTNFPVIRKRALYFKDIQAKKASGDFEKYTKKERIKLEKDFQGMKNKFEGIQDLEKLPEAIFICDIVKDDLPLKEARMKGVKSVALVDSNANPLLVDYPIPANDDALTAVKYMLEKVKETILEAKK